MFVKLQFLNLKHRRNIMPYFTGAISNGHLSWQQIFGYFPIQENARKHLTSLSYN
jgi:hypothetical protein